MRVISINDRIVFISYRKLQLDVPSPNQPVKEILFGYWSTRYLSPLYHQIFKDNDGRDIVFSDETEIEAYAEKFLPGLQEFNAGQG